MAVDQIGTASTVIPQRVVAFKGEPESTPVAYQPRESSSGSGVNALLGLTALAAVVVAGLALHKSGKAATAIEELTKKAGKATEAAKPAEVAKAADVAKAAEAAKPAEVAKAADVVAAAPNVRTTNVIKAEHDVAKTEYEAAAKQLKDAAPNYEANPDGVAELAEKATTKKAAYEKLAKELDTKKADDFASKTLETATKEHAVAKAEYETAANQLKAAAPNYEANPDGVAELAEKVTAKKATYEKLTKELDTKKAQEAVRAHIAAVPELRYDAAVANLRKLAPQYATKPAEVAAARKEVADAYTALKKPVEVKKQTLESANVRHEAAVANLQNLAPQYATKPTELAAAKKEVADAYAALKGL